MTTKQIIDVIREDLKTQTDPVARNFGEAVIAGYERAMRSKAELEEILDDDSGSGDRAEIECQRRLAGAAPGTLADLQEIRACADAIDYMDRKARRLMEDAMAKAEGK